MEAGGDRSRGECGAEEERQQDCVGAGSCEWVEQWLRSH